MQHFPPFCEAVFDMDVSHPEMIGFVDWMLKTTVFWQLHATFWGSEISSTVGDEILVGTLRRLHLGQAPTSLSQKGKSALRPTISVK